MSNITIKIAEDLSIQEIEDFMDSLLTQHRPLIKGINFEVE